MAKDIVVEVGERARRVDLFSRALIEAKKQLQEVQAKVESLTLLCEKETKALDACKVSAAVDIVKQAEAISAAAAIAEEIIE